MAATVKPENFAQPPPISVKYFLVTEFVAVGKAIVHPSLTSAPYLQSWTEVLTHLSKTNYFYQHSSLVEKTSFLLIAKPPLFPFSMLKYALWTLPRDYNIEKGRGVEMLKLETERLRRSTKQGFLGECLNNFCP